MLVDPRVIQCRVIRHEIEQRFHAALFQAFAKTGQRIVAAEVLVNRVTLDGVRRAGNVVVRQIGEQLAEAGNPLLVTAETALLASPVCQTPIGQIQSKPRNARESR